MAGIVITTLNKKGAVDCSQFSYTLPHHVTYLACCMYYYSWLHIGADRLSDSQACVSRCSLPYPYHDFAKLLAFVDEFEAFLGIL